MLVLVIMSFLVLGGFILLSCALFSIPESYSAFSAEWRAMDMKVNMWSYVTALAAILMVLPMIDSGVENTFQFTGFFAPLYLIVVALTPDWDIKLKQHIVHTVGAIICALFAFAWLIVVRGHWLAVVLCMVAVLAGALLTKTLKRSIVFWGEMIMFASVYLSLCIGYI